MPDNQEIHARINAMREAFPESFDLELEGSAAALAASYLLEHWQTVDGGKPPFEKATSDAFDVAGALSEWRWKLRGLDLAAIPFIKEPRSE